MPTLESVSIPVVKATHWLSPETDSGSPDNVPGPIARSGRQANRIARADVETPDVAVLHEHPAAIAEPGRLRELLAPGGALDRHIAGRDVNGAQRCGTLVIVEDVDEPIAVGRPRRVVSGRERPEGPCRRPR